MGHYVLEMDRIEDLESLTEDNGDSGIFRNIDFKEYLDKASSIGRSWVQSMHSLASSAVSEIEGKWQDIDWQGIKDYKIGGYSLALLGDNLPRFIRFGKSDSTEAADTAPTDPDNEPQVNEPEFNYKEKLDSLVSQFRKNRIIDSKVKHREAYSAVGEMVLGMVQADSSYEITDFDRYVISFVDPAFTMTSAGGKGGSGKSSLLEAIAFGLNERGKSYLLADLDPEDNTTAFVQNAVSDDNRQNSLSRVIYNLRKEKVGKPIEKDAEETQAKYRESGINVYDYRREINNRDGASILPGGTGPRDMRMKKERSKIMVNRILPEFAKQIPTDFVAYDLQAGADEHVVRRWNNGDLRLLVADLHKAASITDPASFVKMATIEYISVGVLEANQYLDRGDDFVAPEIGDAKFQASELTSAYQQMLEGSFSGSADLLSQGRAYGNSIVEARRHEELVERVGDLTKKDIQWLARELDKCEDDPEFYSGAQHLTQLYNKANGRIKDFLDRKYQDLENTVVPIGNKWTSGEIEYSDNTLQLLADLAEQEIGFVLTEPFKVRSAPDLWAAIDKKGVPFFYDNQDPELQKQELFEETVEDLTHIVDIVEGRLEAQQYAVADRYLGGRK